MYVLEPRLGLAWLGLDLDLGSSYNLVGDIATYISQEATPVVDG